MALISEIILFPSNVHFITSHEVVRYYYAYLGDGEKKKGNYKSRRYPLIQAYTIVLGG